MLLHDNYSGKFQYWFIVVDVDNSDIFQYWFMAPNEAY